MERAILNVLSVPPNGPSSPTRPPALRHPTPARFAPDTIPSSREKKSARRMARSISVSLVLRPLVSNFRRNRSVRVVAGSDIENDVALYDDKHSSGAGIEFPRGGSNSKMD